MSLPALTDDARHIRDELIAAQPDEGDVLLDYQDPDGPGGMIEAAARVLDVAGVQVVRKLRAELSPLNCIEGLPIWEASLGLAGGRIANYGSTAQRQAQIVSKLREYGAPTLPLIRSVLNGYLGYADPTEILISEVDRDALRALHTYRWAGAMTIDSGSEDLFFDVADDALVAEPGPQVDLSLTCSDLSLLQVYLTAPDSTSASVGLLAPLGRGGAASPRAFALVTSGLTIRAMTSLPASVVWAVGDGGAIRKWNGSTWTAQTSGTMTDLFGVSAIQFTLLGTTYQVVWAVGDGGVILLGNGLAGTWTSVTSPTTEALYGVYTASSSEAVAVGHNWYVAQFDGAAWNYVAPPAGHAGDATCVTKIGSLYYIGDSSGTLYSFDGVATWTSLGVMAQPVRGIWGSSATDIWLVGDSGAAAHYDATGLHDVSTGSAVNLYAVWGDEQRAVSVWAAGAGGVLLYYNGATWADFPSPTMSDLYAVWGTSSGDVWLGGVDTAHYVTGATGQALRFYFPSLAGLAVAGRWRLTMLLTSGSGTLTDAGLFVEGIGLDSKGGNGRGGVKFMWGVVVDPSKLGPLADLDAAQAAVDRLCYATREGSILLRADSSGVGAIPDTDTAIPDLAIPG